MSKYVKPFILCALAAVITMMAEVALDLLQPRLMTVIVDRGVLGIGNGGVGDLMLVMRFGAIMIAMALAGAVFGVLNNSFVNIAAQNSGNMIRKDCFERIMQLSVPQIDSMGTGTLITRMTNDITRIQALVSHFTRGLVRTGMLTLGSLFFMLELNTTFALLVLACVPFIVITLFLCLRRVMPILEQIQLKLDDVNDVMQEDLSGIRIIKACVREHYEKERFGSSNASLIKLQLTSLIIFAFMNPVMNLIMNAATILILYSGSRQFATGDVTPGVIMAAITYTTQLLSGILSLNMLFQNIARGIASWKRIGVLLGLKSDMAQGEDDPSAEFSGSVEFCDVCFSYPGSDSEVLHDISFRIAPGETIGIMGATGSGKTTLAHLIPRLYDATRGSVLVGGKDVREYSLRDLREHVSIAFQKPQIFSESIRENISWGLDDASDEEIRKAGYISRADEFIDDMPQGYDSMLEESGMNLSGGQKQRIALARAVIRNCDILILDDATSALDLSTEAEFYERIREARRDVTRIIIAQRIASVSSADRLIIMDGGRIADMGTHSELMERCGIYRDIYESQLGEEAVDGRE